MDIREIKFRADGATVRATVGEDTAVIWEMEVPPMQSGNVDIAAWIAQIIAARLSKTFAAHQPIPDYPRASGTKEYEDLVLRQHFMDPELNAVLIGIDLAKYAPDSDVIRQALSKMHVAEGLEIGACDPNSVLRQLMGTSSLVPFGFTPPSNFMDRGERGEPNAADLDHAALVGRIAGVVRAKATKAGITNKGD